MTEVLTDPAVEPETTDDDSGDDSPDVVTFADGSTFADDGLAETLRQAMQDIAENIAGKLRTLGNLRKKLGEKFGEYREVCLTADGSPDWSGSTERYTFQIGQILDTLVADEVEDLRDAARKQWQASIAYHTRAWVADRIPAYVRERHPDADAVLLETLVGMELGKQKKPSNSRNSPTEPGQNDSPQDEAAQEKSARANALALVKSAQSVAVPTRAEIIHRLASDLFSSIQEEIGAGIPGNDDAQESIGRAVIVLKGCAFVLKGTATATHVKQAEAALLRAVEPSVASQDGEPDGETQDADGEPDADGETQDADAGKLAAV